MTRATYYVQECPTCGRRLQIRVEYLGKLVACQHCRGQFEASDGLTRRKVSEPGSSLLSRAEELLSIAPPKPATS
jgi:hypothetical protein